MSQGNKELHSFIHTGDLYITSSKDYYSEALPAKSQTKTKDFREKFRSVAIRNDCSSMGRSFACGCNGAPINNNNLINIANTNFLPR